MTPWLFAGVAVAGGLGAALRFTVDGALRTRLRSRFPWPTVLINVSGSLLLGLVTGLALGAWLAPGLAAILGTGLLGGYTTFSTASYETVTLVRQGRHGAALTAGLGVAVTAVGAAALGLWVGLGAP